jgi:hypothetical protein
MPPPQTQEWPSDKAVLLVHGVGNATPGSYDPLVQQLKSILGGEAGNVAIYFLYYDQINQWFATKTQAAALFSSFLGALKARAAGEKVADTAADFAGDVVWPILITAARFAVRAAYLAQLQQIIEDGKKKNGSARNLRVSIICHSLGCFHTYEILHEIAADPGQGLGPVDGVIIENVVHMAPPVQLIRTVARDLGVAVPDPGSLHCLSGASLSIPSVQIGTKRIPSVKNWVSITGNLDPVGGYFFRHRADWAYMDVVDQHSYIDKQEILKNISSEAELEAVLKNSLQEKSPPKIEPQNPHDWSAYLANHADDLKTWLT